MNKLTMALASMRNAQTSVDVDRVLAACAAWMSEADLATVKTAADERRKKVSK